jgi:hypothetical protein
MRQDTLAYLTLGGLAVLTVVVALASHTLSQLDGKLARDLAFPNSKEPMQTLTETVTLKDGRKITVTTTRGSEEELDTFIARHNATVAALLA